MFTVKATYRAETRKFSFPLSSFPTFDQLNDQLYRVFPISQNYYLSRLLFCSETTNPSYVVLAVKVSSAEDYYNCIASFQHTPWQHALLKFSVFDVDIPHVTPTAPAGDKFQPRISTAPVGARPLWRPFTNSASGNASTNSSMHNDSRPVSFCHIPPPPVIFSATSPIVNVNQAFPEMSSQSTAGSIFDPPFAGAPLATPMWENMQKQATSTTSSCCDISQAKLEVQRLITSFKSDLDKVLTTFGNSSASLPSFVSPVIPGVPPLPSVKTPHVPQIIHYQYWCVSCLKPLLGSWFACQLCPFHVMCHSCQMRGEGASHQSTQGPGHSYKLVPCSCSNNLACLNARLAPSPPWLPPNSTYHTPVIPYGSVPVAANAYGLKWLPSGSTFPPPISSLPAFPFAPGSFPGDRPFVPPVPEYRSPVTTPTSVYSLAPGVTSFTPPQASHAGPPPLVHTGVTCRTCYKTVVGVRHKCLDCTDFDLCTTCMDSGAALRHDPFHEFIDIKEPGRVIVHNVFSGDGERVAESPRLRNVTHDNAAERHNATCDLCDSRIMGLRYKCLNCPDFDTCASCFTITKEQHPNHGFVKIYKQSDYLVCNKLPLTSHYATCDGCNKTIIGVRYKCMHPECPDFDLCANCEAHPIPMHTPTHPMLKMKEADTMVPTVHRVGHATLIPPSSPRVIPRTRCRSRSPSPARSYSRGYLHNPSARSVSPVQAPPLAPLYSPHFLHSREVSPPPTVIKHYAPFQRYPKRIDSPRGRRITSPPILSESTMSPESVWRRKVYRPRSRSPNAYGRHQTVWMPPCSRSRSSSRGSVCPRRHRRSRSFERSRSPWTPPIIRPVVCSVLSSPSPVVAPSVPLPAPVSVDVLELASPVDETAGIGGRAETGIGASASSSISAGSTTFTLPPLSLDPASDIFREFWPKVAQELKHLMQGSQEGTQGVAVGNATAEVPTNISVGQPIETSDKPAVIEASLTGEALLKRPETSLNGADISQVNGTPVISVNRSLAALLNGFQPASTVTVPSSLVSSVTQSVNDMKADFISDITVPDGQVFPPGAEFVKSWRITNIGKATWPASTELVFAAGEQLAKDGSEPRPVAIGSVSTGKSVDVWTGELKAPDVPGRYVSYWKLRDAQQSDFGLSLWIDITVVELNNRSESASEDSLASSSIVMPQSAPVRSAAPSDAVTEDKEVATSSISLSPVTAPSKPPSDNGSDSDSVSLMSVPSSEDDDEFAWEDSRLHAEEGRSAMEYVVLYDDSSSEEEI